MAALAKTGPQGATVQDRRVRRTHRQLREALISLTLERGWDDVSVQDVCERADVGRSTFYVHFADKEELLLSGIDELHASMDAVRLAGRGNFQFAEALIAHAGEQTHLRIYRALMGRKSGQRMHNMFRDLVMRLVAADLASLGIDDAHMLAVTRYVGGGFMAMMTEWIDHPARLAPETLAKSFRALTLAALAPLTRD